MVLHLHLQTQTMQEITASGSGRRAQAGRVDLTPMVDLGFLLITFFIFTTTMSTQTAMKLMMPADSNDSTKVAASGAITLVARNSGIGFMRGNSFAEEQVPWNDKAQLRDKLLQVRKELLQASGNDDKLFVHIVPAGTARFGQIIDLLDEMTICGIRRYALGSVMME